jgi:hypothetical protein
MFTKRLKRKTRHPNRKRISLKPSRLIRKERCMALWPSHLRCGSLDDFGSLDNYLEALGSGSGMKTSKQSSQKMTEQEKNLEKEISDFEKAEEPRSRM